MISDKTVDFIIDLMTLLGRMESWQPYAGHQNQM